MLRLLNIIEKNYPEIYQHGERVSKVLSLFLEYAGINRKIIEQASLAAKVHDVGKAMIPIDILKKEEEGIPFSKEEERIWKKHPRLGLEVINKYYDLVKKKCVTIDDAIDKIDRDHGNIDPYWISMFKKFLRNKSNRRKVEKILG